MKKFRVNYSENHIYEIVIEAESAIEADRIVSDGEADYDKAQEIDSTLVDINHVEEVTE